MTIDTGSKIHEAVKQRYGAIARSRAQTCCGADDCCSSDLYNAEIVEGLPLSVTGLSLGCGDPVTIAGLEEGETVLDLGSGAGIDCFLAARQVGESGRVIGVDMTPDMLARANANREKMGVANVEFRRGQIEDLPVEDETVDVIMSNCVINLSPNKGQAFSEAFRVLKPGGRMSISDIVTHGAFNTDARNDMDQWAACVSGAIDAEDYLRLMRDAGFEDVRIVDKVDAGDLVGSRDEAPTVFSARITARRPITS